MTGDFDITEYMKLEELIGVFGCQCHVYYNQLELYCIKLTETPLNAVLINSLCTYRDIFVPAAYEKF